MEILFRNINIVAIQIGSKLAPAVAAILKPIAKFVKFLSQDEAARNMAVRLGILATVVTGLTTVIATGALVYLKFRAALLAANIAIGASTLAIRVLVGSTGLGLLVIILADIALNWNKLWPAMVGVFERFVLRMTNLSEGLNNIILSAITFDQKRFELGMKQIKEAFKSNMKDMEEISKESAQNIAAAGVEGFTGETGAAAPAGKKAKKAPKPAVDKDKIAIKKLENDLLILQTQSGNQKEIELKKEKLDTLKKLDAEDNVKVRAALQKKLAGIESDQMAHDEKMKELRLLFNEEFFVESEEFNELNKEQQNAVREEQFEAVQDQLMTEAQIKKEFQAQELKNRVAANKKLLMEQQKFGKALAKTRQILDSEHLAGVRRTSGDLAKLAQSRSATLKSIGKAAQIANIVIDTARAATGAVAALSFIPIIGPSLGIAAAAAIIAFGAEQVRAVNAAQDGALVQGGTRGKDSVPFMLEPGELVTPRRNFEEVVGAVARQREIEAGEPAARETLEQEGGTSPQEVVVSIAFDNEEASQVLTAKQIEDRSLGISRES